MEPFLILIFAYLFGAFPSAYYAGKWARGIDLRTVGSGNLGFTNAWRMLGPTWSIPVLLVDVLKGYLPVLLAHVLVPESVSLPILAGFVAIIGHTWTIFLGFKGGGKGVATSAGVFLALTPVPLLITLIVFLAVLVISRYMSLASVIGAVTLAISGSLLCLFESIYAPSWAELLFIFIAAALILYKHRSNMRRLIQGTEPKLKKNPAGEAVQ